MAEPQVATLAEVVRRAADACDPEGESEAVDQLLRRTEDRDEPVTSVGDVEEALGEPAGAVDPEREDPALAMTLAVAAYLAHRRDELGEDREEVLRLAARAEFSDGIPEHVRAWLEDEGVAV